MTETLSGQNCRRSRPEPMGAVKKPRRPKLAVTFIAAFMLTSLAAIDHVRAAYGTFWMPSVPTCCSGSANSSYSSDSSGQTVTWTWLGTGTVGVNFNGLSTGGVAFASPYSTGSTPYFCGVNGVMGTNPTRVTTNCRHPLTLASVNTQFTAAYLERSGLQTLAEGYVQYISSGGVNRTYNSHGGSNTVADLGNGRATVTFGGLDHTGSDGGSAMVTSLLSNVTCRIEGWGPVQGSTNVTVVCVRHQFNGQGQLVLEPALGDFNVYYGNDVTANAGTSYAYVWANDPTSASYQPALGYQQTFRANQGVLSTPITAGRTAVGTYFVDIPTLGPTHKTNALVVSYGTSATQCQVLGWGSRPAPAVGTRVLVKCFALGTTNPADSLFVLQFGSEEIAIQ